MTCLFVEYRFFLGSEKSDMLMIVEVRVHLIRTIAGAAAGILIPKGEFPQKEVGIATTTDAGIEEREELAGIEEVGVEIEIVETEIDETTERTIEIEIKIKTEKATGLEIGIEKETGISLEIEMVEGMTTEEIDAVLLRRKGSFTYLSEGKVMGTRTMTERLAEPWLIIRTRICLLVFLYILLFNKNIKNMLYLFK